MATFSSAGLRLPWKSQNRKQSEPRFGADVLSNLNIDILPPLFGSFLRSTPPPQQVKLATDQIGCRWTRVGGLLVTFPPTDWFWTEPIDKIPAGKKLHFCQI